MPLEEQAERARGRLPPERIDEIRSEALARGLAGGLHAVEHGGQGWSHVEWFLVEEQFGRSTNALSWHIPSAYNVLAHGTARADRALPASPRCAASCTTPTRSPRSTPARTRRGSRPPRRRTDAGWRIDGEKWFVTYGDVAAVYIVMANALVDGAELPTLFLVDRGTPGIEVVDDPPFTHSYPHGHPTLRFSGVEVARRGDHRRPRAAATNSSAAGSPRSAWASRRAASARCGG